MDETAIRERLKTELLSKVSREIESPERKKLEDQYHASEQRYKALRSTAGLMLGDDPETHPKTDPWPHCADVGINIEQTIIQELIPNVMQAHLGSKPLTETQTLTERGLQPAGEVDDLLYYELVQKAKIKPIRRQTLLTAYKCGEGIEKVVLERRVRYATDSRKLLVSGNKILMTPDGQEFELFPGEDLHEKAFLLVQSGDDREKVFRYSQEALKLTADQALEAAGVEAKEETIRFAVIIPDPAGGMPQPDWANADTYRVPDVKVSEEVLVNQGIKITKVHPKNLIWPSDAKSNDIMDFWICHRYWPTLEWVLENKKGPEQPDGFDPEAVDALVDRFKLAKAEQEKAKNKDQGEVRPQVWEVYDNFVMNVDNPAADDYLQAVEIIVWFTPNEGENELLGWKVNPGIRFPIHHIRPFFVFQPKPEDHCFHGDSVPETGTGYRDMIDNIVNGALDSYSLYRDPILVMSRRCFAEEQNQMYGPRARFIKEAGETLDVMKLGNVDFAGKEFIGMFTQGLRLLWGAGEHFSGFSPPTQSGTLGEMQAIQASGSQMFSDSVESISQVCDTMYDYIRCLYRYSAEASNIRFPTRVVTKEGKSESMRMQLTQKLLDGTLLIQSRRALTEIERAQKASAIGQFLPTVAKLAPGAMGFPPFQEQVLKVIRDLFNLENLDIPTAEQLQQFQAMMQKAAAENAYRERMQKAVTQIQDKKLRRQVEMAMDKAGGGLPLPPGTPPAPPGQQPPPNNGPMPPPQE